MGWGEAKATLKHLELLFPFWKHLELLWFSSGNILSYSVFLLERVIWQHFPEKNRSLAFLPFCVFSQGSRTGWGGFVGVLTWVVRT